jgi:uncharacterized RDD family membrane protein YckC
MEWYAKVDDKQLGPMSDEALRAMAGTGKIVRDTLIWRAGLKEWIAAGSVPGILIPPDSTAPMTPPNATPSREAASTPPAAATAIAPAVPELTPPPNLAAPWQRFWARSLDILIWSTLIGFLVGILWPSLFQKGGFFAETGGEQILGWLIMPFAFGIDAIAFAAFGNTLGKWIAGVKVMGLRGERLGFLAYMRRNGGVYWAGLGTGFPLVSLFTLLSSYNRASKGEVLSWDQNNGTRSYAVSDSRVRLWLVAIIYLSLFAVLRVIGAMNNAT